MKTYNRRNETVKQNIGIEVVLDDAVYVWQKVKHATSVTKLSPKD